MPANTMYLRRQDSGGGRLEVSTSPRRNVRASTSDLAPTPTAQHKRKTSDAGGAFENLAAEDFKHLNDDDIHEQAAILEESDDEERGGAPLLRSGSFVAVAASPAITGRRKERNSRSSLLRLAAVVAALIFLVPRAIPGRKNKTSNTGETQTAEESESARARAHESVGPAKMAEMPGHVEVGPPLQAHGHGDGNVAYYQDPTKFPRLKSTGPAPFVHQSFAGDAHAGGEAQPQPQPGGWRVFEHVCVADDVATGDRELVYFTDDDGESPSFAAGRNDDTADVNDNVNDNVNAFLHPLGGSPGLRVARAKSISDWTNNSKNGNRSRNLSPRPAITITSVRLYRDPALLMQYSPTKDTHDAANAVSSSPMDALFTYIPHWTIFHDKQTDATTEPAFPFRHVLLPPSDAGCLYGHGKNHSWFCEVARKTGAFGSASEILTVDENDNDNGGDDQNDGGTALRCFEKLYYNDAGHWRRHDSHGEKEEERRTKIGGEKEKEERKEQTPQRVDLTRDKMNHFRDVLFRELALPRPRDLTPIHTKDKAIRHARNKRVTFYNAIASDGGNGGGEGIWTNLDVLIQGLNATKISSVGNNGGGDNDSTENFKYAGVEFATITPNFNSMSVGERAIAYNEADVLIVVPGVQHSAENAIFAADGAAFIQLSGCGNSDGAKSVKDALKGTTMIGDPRFLELIGGTYRKTERCDADAGDGDICLKCNAGGGGGGGGFVMGAVAFERLVDDALANVA